MPTATGQTITQVQAELMRRDYSRFMREAWPVIEPHTPLSYNWHLDCIADYLMAVTFNEIHRLVINIPPRFLKSSSVTIMWPCWEWTSEPYLRYLFSSYALSLSRDHSRKRRAIMESEWYRERFGHVFDLVGDQNEVTHYANDQGGHMLSRGTDGGGTGKGGNRVIIDDPHNTRQAESEVQRQRALDDYDLNLSTRLDDPKNDAIILVMQRLNVKDLTGHCLEQGGWTHLKIPQEPKVQVVVKAPGGNEYKREAGELIHEARFGREENESAKIVLGSYGYAGQQQQEPAPEGGGRIKLAWFPRYSKLPDQFDEIVHSWDTAQKAKDINNPSACIIAGRKENQWYLIEVITERLIYPDLKQRVVSLESRDRAKSPVMILIEDKSSGQSLIQELKRETALTIKGVEPESDKVTRMDTQLAWVEAGNISLPNALTIRVQWLADFEGDLLYFPEPEIFDRIDALSQLIKWIRMRESNIVRVRKLSGA